MAIRPQIARADWRHKPKSDISTVKCVVECLRSQRSPPSPPPPPPCTHTETLCSSLSSKSQRITVFPPAYGPKLQLNRGQLAYRMFICFSCTSLKISPRKHTHRNTFSPRKVPKSLFFRPITVPNSQSNRGQLARRMFICD
jgi:hypothetical protein